MTAISLGVIKGIPLAGILGFFMVSPVAGQEDVSATDETENALFLLREDAEVVRYPADFFIPYNPVNARDMVDQVPGFRIDEGGGARGFGGAAGNLLINGERPSTKNDDAGEILSRIPATQVLRIDLIRGETGGLNLRGQSVVVNVMLREDAAAATRWESAVRTTATTDTLNPEVSISRMGRWGATRYTMGLEGGENRFQQGRGIEWLLSEGRIGEERLEVVDNEGRGFSGNLNTETGLGETIIHFNAKAGKEKFRDFEGSLRLARAPEFTSRTVLEGNANTIDSLELGSDVEFPLAEDFTAKTIALFNLADSSGTSSLRRLNPQGVFESSSQANRETEEKEMIARLELDWSGLAGHHLEGNFEGTLNTLDNALSLVEDSGEGPQEVPLPGANTRVEEVRWDIEFTHSWNPGPLVMDSGVAAEISTISQSGDAERERSFFFLKPRIMLTYAPLPERQLRMRLQREVAQLDFFDFVSSTNFGDNQFDLGNPELKPENTWVSAITYEQRFGEVSVVNLTAFHHWINDVQDKLPLSGIFEIPGNIGDGRRWGIEAEITFPLNRLGITGARIDIRGRWQDSLVNDPVTGLSRVLSDEGQYDIRMDFRQNLQNSSVAWGGMIAAASEVPSFGLDEFVETDDIADTLDMDIFLETTRWFGLRTRLQFGNIFNRTFHRDRQVFAGPRDLTALSFREIRNRKRGHSVEISVTGNF